MNWIKLQTSTPSKPEILRMARILGVTIDDALGKYVRFAIWVDSVAVDGVVDGVVDADVDAMLSTTGLCAALRSVGWLADDADGRMVIPNFERHFGEGAKRRAKNMSAQQRWRGKRNQRSITKQSTECLPEKRREEYIGDTIVSPSPEHSAGAESPGPNPLLWGKPPIQLDPESGTWHGITDAQRDLWHRAYPGVDLDAELARAAAWSIARPRERKSNYVRFLGEWMRRAQDNPRLRAAGPAPSSPAPAPSGERMRDKMARVRAEREAEAERRRAGGDAQ